VKRVRVIGVLAAAVLMAGVAACSGSPSDDATASNSPSPTVTLPVESPEPSDTPSESPSPTASSTDGGAGAAESAKFTESTVISGLTNPFEITTGPDGWLWTTERDGKIDRIDPKTGRVNLLVTVNDLFTLDGAGGMLGLALHPDLGKGTDNQYVYTAYSYDPTGKKKALAMKIVRFTYDKAADKLTSPKVVIEGMPGTGDHQAGRIKIGPDSKLYYTIGDQGHLQFSHTCEANNAQLIPTKAQVTAKNWFAYQGKSLRMNLDGSIPSDNPVINGVRSHIFTYGHRNPQGLVFGPGGKLYSSEQGPKTDDEINLLQGGHNYGWPNVAGYKDDKAYVYANWPAWKDCDPDKFSDLKIPAGVPTTPETAFKDPMFTPPLVTFRTVATGYNFANPLCTENYFVCWPTVAASSLDFYTSAAIPGWKNSFLMTTLKAGTVFRVPLDADGKSVGKSVQLFRKVDRYRDTAISADGKTIYVAVDNGGAVAKLDGSPGNDMDDPGSILAFTYKG
jgi:PQQ-dependent dehydrogenase (s-GDH family)